MLCAFHAKRPSPFKDLISGCQFVEGLNLSPITVDGQTWCAYHCPMTDKEEQPTEKATWGEEHLEVFHETINKRRKEALENDSPLDLTGVVFPKDVDYLKLEFPPVLFYRSIFSGVAYFEKATFSGVARFEKATFSGDAWFEKATFSGDARFQEATFSGDAWFDSSGQTTTEGEIRANNFSFADFTNAAFGRDVSFENRQFLKSTSFEGCTFTKAPVFYGCTLHEGTTFPPREKFKDVTNTHAAKAYRTLKLGMEQVRARREEGMFYALEQESRRNQPGTPHSEKLVSYLYQWSANFGESFVRPVFSLALCTCGFFLSYMIIVFIPTGAFSHIQECAYFTMEQLVRPFSAWLSNGGLVLKEPFGANIVIVVLLQIVALVQSLISLTLITLFLLAIRRRFKLG